MTDRLEILLLVPDEELRRQCLGWLGDEGFSVVPLSSSRALIDELQTLIGSWELRDDGFAVILSCERSNWGALFSHQQRTDRPIEIQRSAIPIWQSGALVNVDSRPLLLSHNAPHSITFEQRRTGRWLDTSPIGIKEQQRTIVAPLDAKAPLVNLTVMQPTQNRCI